MKVLVQRTALGQNAPFSLEDVKTHLRVDHDDDDAAILNMGMTAAAEIEGFAQVALLTQSIRVTIFDPIEDSGLTLPIGPVADDAGMTVTIDGQTFAGFEFVGGMRPYLRWRPEFPGMMPSRIVIEYQAGFGDTADNVPPDLRLAIMDQAAAIYDGRSPSDAKSLTTSPHMMRIAARYRGVSA